MKKLLKIISIALASIAIIVIGAALVISSSLGENRIKGWLEKRLSSEIGLKVAIAGFETNLFSRVQIDTVTIVSEGYPENEPLIYIGQIKAGYSIPQLLGETITIRQLLIDSLAVSVKVDSLGRFGIPLLDNPALPSDEPDVESAKFRIDSISLGGAGLSYHDHSLPLAVTLAGAEISARGNQSGYYSARLKIENIVTEYDSLAAQIRNLDVPLSLDTETIRINNATADLEGIIIGLSGLLGMADTMTVDLDIYAEGVPDSLLSGMASRYHIPHISLNNASLRSSVKGRLDNPQIDLNAELSGFSALGFAVQSAVISAHYNDESAEIDTFIVSAFNGVISGNGSMKADTIGHSSLSLALDAVDLEALWKAIYDEESPYRGSIDGHISAEGRIADISTWEAMGNINGKTLRYLNRDVPDLLCAFGIKGGRTAFSLIHGGDEISADLLLEQESMSGSFKLSIPDITALSRFIDQPDLTGGLHGQGTIKGLYSNPAVHSTIYGSKIAYRNFPIDTIYTELSYIDTSFTVIDFSCEGHLDSIDSQHPPLGIDSLSGSLDYACQLNGSMDSLTGKIRAQSEYPRYGSYELDSLSIEAVLMGSRLNITDFNAYRTELLAQLRADYDTLSASGSFDLALRSLISKSDTGITQNHDTAGTISDRGSVRGDFKFAADSNLVANINGQGLWLGLIPSLTADTMVADGTADFDLIIDGPYMTPDAILDVRILSLVLSGFTVDSVTSHLRLMQDALILDSLVSHALGHTMRASGRLELGISTDGMFEIPDSASIMAGLSAADFDLSVLQGFMDPGGDIRGRLSTKLDIGGTIAAPRFDGWLRAQNGLILMEENSTPLENIDLSLKFADSVLSIDNASGIISNMTVVAGGSMTTPDFKSVSAGFNGSIGKLGEFSIDGMISDSIINIGINSDSLNLAVFQPFMTGIDSLYGIMGCRMKIHGELTTPHIDGYLNARSISLIMPGQKVTLSDGQMDIRFDKNKVVLDSAAAILNGGKLALSGVLAHEQGVLQDLGLNLHAHSIILQEPGNYNLSIESAELSFGKQQENYILDGDIVLGEAKLTAGLKPASILPWVKSMETVDIELPELLARSRLDLRIRESDQLWVDNNLARIRLHAELGIIGTPLRPNFTGMLRIEEGYLLYLDRRFRVNEGTIYFIDPIRFNPDINLDAATEITVYRRTAAEPYKIYIKARGLLDQLQYGLYSEPALDKPDIIALLTLGATRAELSGDNGSGKSGLTAALKDRAAMLTSKRISNYLSRKAGALFGFEEFTIQGNLFDINDNRGPQLTATKRLTRRIDLTYSTSVGHLNDQTVRLGYRLSTRFSLQGETDRQGRSGLDLKYGITLK